MKINVIVPAGGTSSRFGATNKLIEEINGKTVIEHSVDAFCIDKIDEIIIPANEAIINILKDKFFKTFSASLLYLTQTLSNFISFSNPLK